MAFYGVLAGEGEIFGIGELFLIFLLEHLGESFEVTFLFVEDGVAFWVFNGGAFGVILVDADFFVLDVCASSTEIYDFWWSNTLVEIEFILYVVNLTLFFEQTQLLRGVDGQLDFLLESFFLLIMI